MTIETITIDWPTEMTYAPPEEELAWERLYWQMQDRIAEYDAWVEMHADEHEYSELCDCDECRATTDEYRAMDREYESLTRGS